MRNNNEPNKNRNNQNNQTKKIKNETRNTSYYKSQVEKSPQKETSGFMDKAKKRQMTSYRLAILVMFLLMIAFAGLISLGAYLRGVVGPPENGGGSGDDVDANLFTAQAKPAPADSGSVFDPDSQTAEQPSDVDISRIFYNYNGVYLDVTKIESLESLQYFIDVIKSKGINAVNIDIKKEDGSVPYRVNSQTASVVDEDQYIDIPAEDIINLLHANEIYVSGTVACFKDNLASSNFVYWSLLDSSTSMKWEDSGGDLWLNAYSADAQNYIKSIVLSGARLGFDEIILSWFFFPDVANEKNISYGDNTSMSKYSVIKDFVTSVRYTLDDNAPNVKLGLEIPLKYFLNIPNETMGLNPDDFADKCNFFATSFAPADIPPGAKISGETISNPESNLLETVKALCAHFKDISDRTNFRPYLQAFNGYGSDRITTQKQALFECDIKTWQLVNYDNIY